MKPYTQQTKNKRYDIVDGLASTLYSLPDYAPGNADYALLYFEYQNDSAYALIGMNYLPDIVSAIIYIAANPECAPDVSELANRFLVKKRRRK